MLKSWEELTPLEQAHETYSDMHKDAYGFRPRIDVSKWTLEDFEAEFKVLGSVIERDLILEKEDQERAQHEVEMQIQNLMSSGAKDRAMAIRWLHEAYDTRGDEEYLCYTLGLPYGYFKQAA